MYFSNATLVYAQLLELWSMANFMPKYGNFQNRTVSRKPLPIERKLAQFRPPEIERECMCTSGNGQVGSQADHQGPWASRLVITK